MPRTPRTAPPDASTDPADYEHVYRVGDRFYSHYSCCEGTIVDLGSVSPAYNHGVTGDWNPPSRWYSVELDEGGRTTLNPERMRPLARTEA